MVAMMREKLAGFNPRPPERYGLHSCQFKLRREKGEALT